MDKISSLIKSDHMYIDDNNEKQYYYEVSDENFINQYNDTQEWKDNEYLTRLYNNIKLKLNI
jgi:hypothetical protein